MTPYKKHYSIKLKSERKLTDKDIELARKSLSKIIKKNYKPSLSKDIGLILMGLGLIIISVALFIGGIGIFVWSLFTESWIRLAGSLIMIYVLIKLWITLTK